MTSPDRVRPASESLAGQLQGRIGGSVIGPGDTAYEMARQVWNARIDRRPALIARPRSADEVATTLRFGIEQGLTVAVKGGGHSVAGHGIVDDGLMIDLAGLDTIDVDPVARRAIVGGGRSWGPVDAATARHGLATTGGQISTTGVGGLTLGGGVGWLMGRDGLTVDNLRSAEIVTADGRIRRIGPNAEPELFWAIRGGGGNFGIVTSFEFDLHPVSTILGGTVIWEASRTRDVIRLYRDLCDGAPDELTLMVLCLAAPRQPFIPEELQGQPVVAIAACWCGDLAEGEEALEPLRRFGTPLSDRLRPMPYVELQSTFDVGSRPGFMNYWKSPFLAELSDKAIDVLVDGAERMPTAISQVLLTNMGGAVARVPLEATAFPHRLAPLYLEIIGKWEPGADGSAAVAWTDAFRAEIDPFTTGHAYVNFVDDEGPDRSLALSYDDRTLRRLAEAKAMYDPDNVFRVNHNIPPARQGR
jgi:hypothetical protein